MIKVNRIDIPEILKVGENPKSEGEIETTDVIDFFSDPVNHNLKYAKMGTRGHRTKSSYTVYSDKEVRKALIKMFHGKCAYCESKITSIYNGDIEHFRPKAGYTNSGEPITKPGYYWLASDWDNLLFSCPFCNQTNSHEIIENGQLKEIVLGKLNQFPLLTETYRLNSTHGGIYISDHTTYIEHHKKEESERLLVKPCTDEVEKHFKYNENGTISPNFKLNDFEKNKAQTSIRVYGLQRLALVQAREAKVIQIKAQLRRVEQAIENFNKYLDTSEEERTWFEGILRQELIELKSFTDKNQEYSGLAKYIITDYLGKAGFLTP
ncbi:MAG: hypothetical protein HWE22_10440 [Flavobacteriales bacterium]|nr:hypothetical protein [Flavobacteriales bacterium]